MSAYPALGEYPPQNRPRRKSSTHAHRICRIEESIQNLVPPGGLAQLSCVFINEASQRNGRAVLDFKELIRSTPYGPRSFPLTGLADLPQAECELVIQALTTPPVNAWLDVSVVQTMPDSPFVVTHVEPSISQKLNFIRAAA